MIYNLKVFYQNAIHCLWLFMAYDICSNDDQVRLIPHTHTYIHIYEDLGPGASISGMDK